MCKGEQSMQRWWVLLFKSNEQKKGRKIPKITLVEVIKKDVLIKEVIEYDVG